MASRFKELTPAEFKWSIDNYPWRRKITSFHVHHTWKPDHSMWKGLRSVIGMWSFHTKNRGWSDIAQHITLAPDGGIWTGRNWNKRPVSSARANGSRRAGPFMVETVGNFDTGHDKLEGAQLENLLYCVGYILYKFKLPITAVKFHRHLGSPKTCPGTGVDYDNFKGAVRLKMIEEGWVKLT